MSVALSPASVVELLKRLQLFSSLSERDLLWLADRTRVDHLERDAVIFYQGDPCERVCILRQGQVKIVHHDEGGREVILEMISAGEVFGGAVSTSYQTSIEKGIKSVMEQGAVAGSGELLQRGRNRADPFLQVGVGEAGLIVLAVVQEAVGDLIGVALGACGRDAKRRRPPRSRS